MRLAGWKARGSKGASPRAFLFLSRSIDAQALFGGRRERTEVTTMGPISQDFLDSFEIVHVIGQGRLIDAESYERTIWARDGGSLAVGFYVVCWSAAGLEGTFGDDATFRGPFRDRQEAWAAVEQLREQFRAQRLAAMPRGSPQTIAADGDRGAPPDDHADPAGRAMNL
jgi:hypothetical protein